MMQIIHLKKCYIAMSIKRIPRWCRHRTTDFGMSKPILLKYYALFNVKEYVDYEMDVRTSQIMLAIKDLKNTMPLLMSLKTFYDFAFSNVIISITGQFHHSVRTIGRRLHDRSMSVGTMDTSFPQHDRCMR